MKRYLCSILILVSLFMFSFTPSASAVIYRSAGYESHGDWEDDPWEINSVSTFIKFRDDSNSYDNYKSLQKKYFKLTADLDLTSYSDWTAISWIWGDFSGTFDGNGHTIKVRISRNDATEVGLFGKISSGTVKNLHVIGNIKGYRSGEYDDAYVGGIVARLNNGTIENCTFDGTIEGKGGFEDTHVGGIAGYAGSGKVIIKNCRVGAYSATSIYGGVGYFGTNVGGIVGTLIMSDGSSVSNNFVRAEIEAEDQYGSYAHAGNIYGSLGGGGNGISNNETIEPDAVEPEIEIETSALDDGYVGDAYAANLVSDIEGVKWSWLGNTPA